MNRDPIVEEVRAAREQIASDYGYDLAAIFVALRAMGADGAVERVSLPPRAVQRETVEPAAQQAVAADGASRRS